MDRRDRVGIGIDTILHPWVVVVVVVIFISDAQARQGGTLGPRRRLGGIIDVDGRELTTTPVMEVFFSHPTSLESMVAENENKGPMHPRSRIIVDHR